MTVSIPSTPRSRLQALKARPIVLHACAWRVAGVRETESPGAGATKRHGTKDEPTACARRADGFHIRDVCGDGFGHSGHSCDRVANRFEGGGGHFGGGGASGSFDTPGAAANMSDAGAADWGAGDVLGAADELAIPLVALVAAAALALGVAFASIYVVYTAPSLFAEITVDAALSYALVRRLTHGQRRLWLGTAIARTWCPALCTAAFVAVVGASLAMWAPGTTSLAGALRQLFGG